VRFLRLNGIRTPAVGSELAHLVTSRSAALADCVSRPDAEKLVPVELGLLLLVVVGGSSHEAVNVPQPSDAAGVAPAMMLLP
jgi:hypothetical protein